jgi:serine/threonine protein kinase/formylglycine-generating enzyme required for sulfatase activity
VSEQLGSNQPPTTGLTWLDELLHRFQDAWEISPRPSIENYLPVDPGLRSRALAGLVRIDLELRLKQGEAIRVESYLQRFPELASRPGPVIDLIQEEFALRRRSEPTLALTEYLRRFPQYEEYLRQLIADTTTVPPGSEPDSVPLIPLSAGTNHEQLPPKLGRYRITAQLGAGGFGAVYKGYDEELNRDVAIKVPHRHRITRPEDCEAFLTEARVLASLDHPHMVPVYDVGRTKDGLCFVVSKFIAGSDLAKKIATSKLSTTETAELIATVSEALHYAHKRGLVHRDIKPANILLDSQSNPYVADFGLAMREEDHGKQPGVCGTPAYMSPEQANGEGHRVDGRSDIFSVGVVFYELLTGRRPFRGETATDILIQVSTAEVRPPRQIDDTIPKELERICLKTLSKKASDRYTTAKDLAEDLRHLLGRMPEAERTMSARLAMDIPVASTVSPSPMLAPMSSNQTPIRIVPKGLRSFDAQDADFFLGLLPGPRDREGLPDSIRFWKTRIETMDADGTLSVGLIYGPSGCGKSSMVKAGLLPRLAKSMVAVSVEATSEETEIRLLKGLRRQVQDLPINLNLVQSLAALRRGQILNSGQKVLLVLDQFEQWLHATRNKEATELVQALRQCDGRRLQCIIMVRDDFWLAVSRFMQALEIRVIEGDNSRLVDLFDLRHARNVLMSFGRALGALPESTISKEQDVFLDQAVDGLAQEGKVISVRLALFAEMVKGRPWTPITLKDIGGTEGVGVTFLEETFAASTAPPQHRLHQKAAQAVLKALLPEGVTDIRGHLRSLHELLEASGYAHRPRDFEELLRILDSEVRLITPTDPEGRDDADQSIFRADEKYYQLTHDYLVHSLRDWLTHKQRGTRRGRAALLLEDRAKAWTTRPENRQLPTLLQWLQIRCLTQKKDWTSPQSAMMRRASRLHATRAVIRVAVLASVVLIGTGIWTQVRKQQLHDQAVGLVQRLRVADTAQVPGIVAELEGFQPWTGPLLSQALKETPPESKERLHVSLALLREDPGQIEYLSRLLLRANSTELRVIKDALGSNDTLRHWLWDVLRDAQADPEERFRAACALAGWEPANGEEENWRAVSAFVADRLVAAVQQDPASYLAWIAMLRPVREQLTVSLIEIFRNQERLDYSRTAASILGDYAADQPELLADLLADGEAKQYAILLPRVQVQPERAIARLKAELTKEVGFDWKDRPLDSTWSAPHADLVQLVEAAGGMVAERFALCQSLPLQQFQAVSAGLGSCGYRPVRLRPYATPTTVQVDVVWTRDGRLWQAAFGLNARDVQEQERGRRQQGFQPVDVAAYYYSGGLRYASLWVKGEKDDEAQLQIGRFALPSLANTHLFETSPANLQPASLHVLFGPDGVPRSSLVWRKNGPARIAALRDDKGGYAERGKLFGAPIDVSVYDTHQCLEGARESMAWLSGSPWWGLSLHSRRLFPLSSEPSYAGCFERSGDFDYSLALDLTPAQQLQRCKELANQGYRPAALSVAEVGPGRSLRTASVWHRPVVPDTVKEHLALRQANAAAALLKLGQGESVWPLLRHRPDPRLRSYLIHRLSPLGSDARVIARRLDDEPDVSAQRALLLCLGEFGPLQLPHIERQALVQSLLKIYRDNPDPGLHGAAEWLLRQWQQHDPLKDIDKALATGKVEGQRRWYLNRRGQTFVLVLDPPEFRMGSPRTEEGRVGGPQGLMEVQHDRRIGRAFAIANKEVTVEQFLRFRKGQWYDKMSSPTPEHPMNLVNWYEAAAYCNWLSEKEGIPEDQWCYVPQKSAESALAMKMKPNYLSLVGYRLPTEAEWEFACRAGTISSRYYGETDVLLDRYACYMKNAANHTMVVPGTLKPNDLGLFDMLGNALEWCQEARFNYPRLIQQGPLGDPEDALEERKGIQGQLWRVLRGGAYCKPPWEVRSANRDGSLPTGRGADVGFRPARTFRSG